MPRHHRDVRTSTSLAQHIRKPFREIGFRKRDSSLQALPREVRNTVCREGVGGVPVVCEVLGRGPRVAAGEFGEVDVDDEGLELFHFAEEALGGGEADG